MKKSHKWIKAVEARCPYCGTHKVYCTVTDEGALIECRCCGEWFELGRQK